MAIRAGVGISKENDAFKAGYEACSMAVQEAGGITPDLVIVFSSVRYDQKELIRGVREVAPQSLMSGCSDAGEITNRGPMKESVVVMAIKSDTVTFTTALGMDVKAGPRNAGQAVARAIKENAPAPLRALAMFPDVLVGNGADIVRGVLDTMGAHFPVVGGAAGDDFLFQKTFQYHNGEVVSGAVAGVGFSGNFSMGIGMRHGWVPIGMPMKVTKAEGAVLHELDGRPAVSIYEDYFGENTEDLRKEPLARMAITYPLGIKVGESEEYLIRDPITVDEKGSITCAAEIPEGSEVRLMIGSKEKAIEAAQEAARHLMSEFETEKTSPKFVLMFNCIAREKLFGQKANEEIQAVMDILGRDVPLIGFYTYGEQAPLGGEIRDTEKIDSRFYNETMVMFGVGE